MGKRGGKGSRARSRERRAKEKRARKEAMNSMYRKWAETGTNSRSKRFLAKGVRKLRVRTRADLSLVDLLFLVRMKLLQLAGYEYQWSSHHGSEVSKYIRAHWSNIQEAWEAHNIVPVRTDIPVAYNNDNWSN